MTREAILDALAAVRDPELDEPITDLGFIGALELEKGSVHVALRLPTYFCAPNFAYLMVADAKKAILSVPGVREARVTLADHFAANEINTGVADERGFQATFPGEADAELDQLRRLFRGKALIARQERLCRELLAQGFSPEQLAAMRLGDLPSSPETSLYLQRRAELGLDVSSQAPLLVNPNGEPIPEEKVADHLRRARAVPGLCRTDLHIVEGQWKEKTGVELPYTLGHENAGWVHEVGSDVTNVAVGDTVIVHPFVSCGFCRACRAGDDMHCSDGRFPGISVDGGFADLLKTTARALVKLDPGLQPKDVAALADAGLTAYHAVKKAATILYPGTTAVVIGAGGLGHIAIQCLEALTAAEIVVVDRSEPALELAKELGADHTVVVDGAQAAKVQELTDGNGAEAVIDFVGEGGAIEDGIAMLRRAGTYYVIGYGGVLDVPTIDIISTEINFVGNLVGTYNDLAELMTLAAQGKVSLHTSTYPLEAINDAMADLDAGRLRGRGILVPEGAAA